MASQVVANCHDATACHSHCGTIDLSLPYNKIQYHMVQYHTIYRTPDICLTGGCILGYTSSPLFPQPVSSCKRLTKKSILGYTFLIALAGGRVPGLFTGSTLGLVTGALSQDSTQHDKDVHPHPCYSAIISPSTLMKFLIFLLCNIC